MTDDLQVAAKAEELREYVEMGLFNQLRTRIRAYSRQQKKQNLSIDEARKSIITLVNELYERYHIALEKNDDADTVNYIPQIVVSESFI